MYEVVVEGNVVSTVDNVVLASNMTSYYRTQGKQAFYRPVLRKVA